GGRDGRRRLEAPRQWLEEREDLRGLPTDERSAERRDVRRRETERQRVGGGLPAHFQSSSHEKLSGSLGVDPETPAELLLGGPGLHDPLLPRSAVSRPPRARTCRVPPPSRRRDRLPHY